MSITIYKDVSANSIFIEDANGAQFVNSLQASENNGEVDIADLARQIDLLSGIPHTDFVNQNGVTYQQISIDKGGSGDVDDVVNELNTVFQSAGTPSTNIPEITSSLTINSVQGSVINYELTANYGVGYEWDLSNVPGITTVEGNIRKLIGGSNLSSGAYDIPVKAINYNGEDSETIVLTVSNPPFANTKSVQFSNQDWLGANAALLDSTLGRTGNGSGSGDAWTIAFWFKAGGSNSQGQTIFYFGSNDVANGHHIRIKWNGATSSKEQLILQYGSSNNNLTLQTPVGSVTSNGGWNHYIITYDGGTTGSSSGSINSYYSRFKIFKNGVQLNTINTNANYGNTASLTGQNLRIGRYNSSGHMRNSCRLDELAIWDSDQSANCSAIYNIGIPFDLSILLAKPKHWWRMGDGDTYPFLQDSGTEANCIFVMYSMTVADIVSDVP